MLETGEAPFLFIIAILIGLSKAFFTWCDRLKEKAREKLKETMAQLQTIITRRYTVSRQDALDEKQISIDADESENQRDDSLSRPSGNKTH